MKVEELMNKDFVTIPHDATVADAINIIRKRQIHEILVTAGKDLLGLVSSRQLIERSTRLNEKISTITVSPMILEKDLDVQQVVEKFLFGGHRDIPVVDNGVLVGVVSEIDVLGTLVGRKGSSVNKIKAKDCMSPIKFACREDCPVFAVRKSLLRHNVNRVPVVDENGRLVGIISTIDFLKKSGSEKKFYSGSKTGEKIDLEKMDASSMMNKNVFSVKPDDTLEKVIETFVNNRVSSVIVEDAEMPVGIITPKTVLRLVYEPKEPQSRVEVTGVEDEEIRYTIADLAQRKIRKFDRVVEITSFRIGIKSHKKEGNTKYEVRGRIETLCGAFFASDDNWNVFKCVDSVIEKLWKEISSRVGKKKTGF